MHAAPALDRGIPIIFRDGPRHLRADDGHVIGTVDLHVGPGPGTDIGGLIVRPDDGPGAFVPIPAGPGGFFRALDVARDHVRRCADAVRDAAVANFDR